MENLGNIFFFILRLSCKLISIFGVIALLFSLETLTTTGLTLHLCMELNKSTSSQLFDAQLSNRLERRFANRTYGGLEETSSHQEKEDRLTDLLADIDGDFRLGYIDDYYRNDPKYREGLKTGLESYLEINRLEQIQDHCVLKYLLMSVIFLFLPSLYLFITIFIGFGNLPKFWWLEHLYSLFGLALFIDYRVKVEKAKRPFGDKSSIGYFSREDYTTGGLTLKGTMKSTIWTLAATLAIFLIYKLFDYLIASNEHFVLKITAMVAYVGAMAWFFRFLWARFKLTKGDEV